MEKDFTYQLDEDSSPTRVLVTWEYENDFPMITRVQPYPGELRQDDPPAHIIEGWEEELAADYPTLGYDEDYYRE